MRALTYHGTRDVRIDGVPDLKIEASTDAIICVTSSGICGSDLHLYEVLGPFIDKVTSWATSQLGSSRRLAPRSRTSRRATAS